MYCHTTECCKLQVPSKTGTFPSPPSPPRTGCVWGDNWRVPWHPARERALCALTATQKLRSCTSVCTSKQQTGGERARVYLRVRLYVLMHVFIRGGGWLFLSFARHNPFLLSLRAPRSNEGWTWKRLTTVLRKASALCFSFLPSFLMPLSSFLSSISSCETLLCCFNNCCVWASTSSELPQTMRWLCHIQHEGLNVIFSFFPFLSLKLFFFIFLCACLLD